MDEPESLKRNVLNRQRVGYTLTAASVAYAIATTLGLLSLKNPNDQIGDPFFSAMELLILVIAPLLVCFTVYAVYSDDKEDTANGIIAIVFISFMAVTTCLVHFSVLTISRALVDENRLFYFVFSFTWPSLAYAADILAWDVFLPVSCLFLIPYLPTGNKTAKAGLVLWITGAALSFIGLIGVPLANMRIRLIGVLGYAIFIPTAVFLFSKCIGNRVRGKRRIP